MATMTERTTFALDRESCRRLKALAARWRVSQSEVVRRALARAEQMADSAADDPAAALKALHAAGRGLVREKAEAYLAEVRRDRDGWRRS